MSETAPDIQLAEEFAKMRAAIDYAERNPGTSMVLLGAVPQPDGTGFSTMVRGIWDANVVPMLVFDLVRRVPAGVRVIVPQLKNFWDATLKAASDAMAAAPQPAPSQPIERTKH